MAGQACLTTALVVAAMGIGSHASAAMSAREFMACAEEAAVQLPRIPALTITRVETDTTPAAYERVLDAAGTRQAGAAKGNMRSAVKAAGDRAATVTLYYSAGAIQGARIFTCIYPGDDPLVLPLGRAD